MTLPKNLKTKNKEFYFCFIVFAVFLFKYLIYGFTYFPVLDDYIQYGGYPMYNNIGYVLFDIGTISTRPLAAFLDVAFWGSLWQMPHLMLIFSCLFHLLSCVFFYKTAKENNIELSPMFAIFYLFFPLGSEGSFWISASSRIVVGLFFSSIAAYTLTKYTQKGKIKHIILFILNALFAFCLYEACAVFCCLICAAVLIVNRKEKRFLLPAVSLVLLLIILLVYMKLGQNIGRMGSRASESSFLLIFMQLPKFVYQLLQILTWGIYTITVHGFAAGLKVLIAKGIIGIIYMLAIFILCILMGKVYSSYNTRRIPRKILNLRIIGGIILFFAPFAPNLMASPVWITYRTMFIPLIGLYIILDALFSNISKKSVQTILLMVLMFIFTVSSVNEYDTYKRANELDQKLLATICAELPESVLNGEHEAAVLLDAQPTVKQVSYFKDHVKCSFHEDWALTGALRAYSKRITIKKVTPVYPESDYDYSECFVVDLRGKR